MARRRGSGRVLDMKQWTSIQRSAVNITSNTTTLGGGVQNFLEPGTILRCRGFVEAHFDNTAQIGDEMNLTWALGVVSSDAAVAGAGSMPDPGGEPDYPWLWWGSMKLFSEVAAGPTGGWGPAAQRLEIDTKAMRRVKPGQALVIIVESAGESGAPVTSLEFGQLRVLVGT